MLTIMSNVTAGSPKRAVKEVRDEAALSLVTGAGGHLGTMVVRRLADRGMAVRALVLPGERGPSGSSAMCAAANLWRPFLRGRTAKPWCSSIVRAL